MYCVFSVAKIEKKMGDVHFMTRGSLARGRNPPLVDSKSTQMLFKSQHVEQCNLSLVAVQTNGRERGGGRKSKVL